MCMGRGFAAGLGGGGGVAESLESLKEKGERGPGLHLGDNGVQTAIGEESPTVMALTLTRPRRALCPHLPPAHHRQHCAAPLTPFPSLIHSALMQNMF